MHDIPAFPTDSHEYNYQGMTLRDYFAAKAMQGLLAGLLADGQDIEWEIIARNSYWQADKMMKARK